MDTDRGLYELVFERVADDSTISERVKEIILGAFADESTFTAALAGEQVDLEPAHRPTSGAVPEMYISRISATAFRGIGPARDLELRPGPGLTLVIGRNGSGKSSFAEAAELAITGHNRRWDKRTNPVLRKGGWRNLHATEPTDIAVDLTMAGHDRPTTVRMSWAAGADLEDRQWTAQQPPGRRTPFDVGPWATALELFRPFLSYNELGSVLESTPYQLHGELHRLLGLGAVDAALAQLATTRLTMQKRADALRDEKKVLLIELGGIDDPRAMSAAAALTAKQPDLAAIAELARGDAADSSQVSAQRALLDLAVPSPEQVRRAAQAVRDGVAATTAATTATSVVAASIADLLDRALTHHSSHGDQKCPVCSSGVLDADWRARSEQQLVRQREVATTLQAARSAQRVAVDAVRQLIGEPPAVLLSPPPGAEVDSLVTVWQRWCRLRIEPDPSALATALTTIHPALTDALAAAQEQACTKLATLDEVWRPITGALLGWHGRAVVVAAERGLLRDLKAAETWLKRTASALADARVAPIAARSQQVWEQLRQESGVTLQDVRLTGRGSLAKLVLDVSVEGADSSALGVMSQGELHALALALFLPRATADASPFRFLIIDDPVQAMDPSKVDGLARALAQFAQDRQVIVFSHDDRLAAAVRRLAVSATILEVTRLDRSCVAVGLSSDPAARYLADARSLASAKDLPGEVTRELVSASCRNALDSAAIQVVQGRRLARGESHADIEDLLGRTNGTRALLALALFDDAAERDKVDGHFKRYSWANDVLRACAQGGHVGYRGDLHSLIDNTKVLVERVRR